MTAGESYTFRVFAADAPASSAASRIQVTRIVDAPGGIDEAIEIAAHDAMEQLMDKDVNPMALLWYAQPLAPGRRLRLTTPEPGE